MQERKPGAKRSTCLSILSDTSRDEPFGTWQYAQAMCFPAGARVGSNKVGWASKTNGWSAISPFHGARSDAAISSKVPPRCTVPARAQASAFHGIGVFKAQSTLQTPGP